MTQMNIQQAMELAIRQHQAGRLNEAEQLCRQILAQEPKRADALHLLGMIAAQHGRHDVAADLYRQAIALKPNYPQAYNDLGIALGQQGQLEQAIAAFRQALGLQPYYAEAYNNLGLAFSKSSQADQAIAAFAQAIKLRPDFAEAYNHLGIALGQKGQLDQAIAAYRQAIALRPNFTKALNNLGTALGEKGQLDQAIAAFGQAIALQSDYAEAYSNVGRALSEKGELDQAIAACRQAIALRPNYSEAYNSLGLALGQKGRVAEAVAAFAQAVAHRPNYAEAHGHLGIGLLLQGDYSRGWKEYQWRWQVKDFLSSPRFTQPQWDGSDLQQRTILVHAEQGLGDTIQFMRYLPMVAQRGGHVVVQCQPELKRLLQGNACDWRVISTDNALPAFDVHSPLLSLPLIFGTTLQSIPAQIPYLQADSTLAKQWQAKMSGDSRSLKVGLAWAGSQGHKGDRHRSIALSVCAPLAGSRDICFYSLQKGPAAQQAKAPPPGMKLIDLMEEVHDFADTAALIANLDLVISVDTAVAHLAGAMGKPVWTVLPFVPDWRWLLQRADSPWYPTMRLFRQPKLGDWDSVLAQITTALADLLQGC